MDAHGLRQRPTTAHPAMKLGRLQISAASDWSHQEGEEDARGQDKGVEGGGTKLAWLRKGLAGVAITAITQKTEPATVVLLSQGGGRLRDGSQARPRVGGDGGGKTSTGRVWLATTCILSYILLTHFFYRVTDIIIIYLYTNDPHSSAHMF